MLALKQAVATTVEELRGHAVFVQSTTSYAEKVDRSVSRVSVRVHT